MTNTCNDMGIRNSILLMTLIIAGIFLPEGFAQSNNGNPFFFKKLQKVSETSDSIAWNFSGSIRLEDHELAQLDSMMVLFRGKKADDVTVMLPLNTGPGRGRFSCTFKTAKSDLTEIKSYKILFKTKRGVLSRPYDE